MVVDKKFIFSLRGTILQVDATRVIGDQPLIRRGKCRVRIFKEHDAEMQVPRAFVLVTDLRDENPGPDINAAVREIAVQVCMAFNIEPFALVFIEHHDNRPCEGVYDFQCGRSASEKSERFDLVHMPWDGAHFGAPQWQFIPKEKVETLIGEKLP
jgi:hypothetical protein